MRLSAVLYRYLDGGDVTAALHIHGRARQAASNTGDRSGEAHALNALGGIHLTAGHHDAAAEHCRRPGR